ncbi:hypothetical protein [Planktotalea arctica]|uniref:hypothetical protein n=1 Tax=Planktotalea arctica TaxID=1481893 RepID=UPI00321B9D67
MLEISSDTLATQSRRGSGLRNSDPLLRRFLGIVCVLVAVGLWITPGLNAGADLLLIKTAQTGFVILIAIATLLSKR